MKTTASEALMRPISLLYHGKVRDSVFDRAIGVIARQKQYAVESFTYPLRAEHRPEKDSLILVRNSELPTALIEQEYSVYPSEQVRQRSKNKWMLHNYCLEHEIPTPDTVRAEDLLEDFVFKRTSGSNNSVVNPFAHADLLAQERVTGQVVKCYGHIQLGKFIGADELTRKSIDIPDTISALGRKVLGDFGLVWGGLDWVIGAEWYLIDVNATSGFGYASLDDCVKLLSEGLDIFFYEEGARQIRHHAAYDKGFPAFTIDDSARH
ncbi:MAG: hypothetical protein FD165_1416 [Gammaproteobacteria bacterium]|nr:MAG: hypothetical protein FD165_1416 [Gammaproteobacteria bacterium]TND03996.1 MAG: hypothetical protein FD120_1705 [Gammaproteobacteria bacterium]